MITGRVVSNKQIKTAIVLVEGTKTDRLYKKSYLRSKKYAADDPIGVKIGDIVELIKVRPVSKRKHWKITKVIGRDIEEVVSDELKEAAAEIIEEVMPAEVEEPKEKEEAKEVKDGTA
jgi:small subunit ribosomal protein S17